MPVSTSTVRTTNGSRYLQQLCKHWSHKFVVEFDPKSGRIPFNDLVELTLQADGATLVLTLAAPEQAQLERYEAVVAEHLKRFAFREELDITWNS